MPVHGGNTRFEHHGDISIGVIRTDNIEDKGEGSKYGKGINTTVAAEDGSMGGYQKVGELAVQVLQIG